METLSLDRILWLEEHFFERQVERDDFDQLKTSEELHRVVENYNWDEGLQVMHWVLESPLCDKGTALLMFWRADPVYETQFSEDPKDWRSAGYQLVQKILEMWQNNQFSEGLISYDPVHDYAADTDAEGHGAWEIPADMRQPTKGEKWPDYNEMYFPAP